MLEKIIERLKGKEKEWPYIDTDSFINIAGESEHIYTEIEITKNTKISLFSMDTNGTFLVMSTMLSDEKAIISDIEKVVRTYMLPANGTFIFIRAENKDYFYDQNELKEIEFMLDRFEALMENTLRPLVDLTYIGFSNNYEMLFEPDLPNEYKDAAGNPLIVDKNEELTYVAARVSKTTIENINKLIEKTKSDTPAKDFISEDGTKYRKYNTRTKYFGYSYKEDYYPVADDNPTAFFLLTLLGGIIGLHKYKTGEIMQGFLYTITFGGFSIFYIFDVLSILLGTYSVNQTSYIETDKGRLKKVVTKVYLDKLPYSKGKNIGLFLVAMLIGIIGTNYIYVNAFNRLNAYLANKAYTSVEERINEALNEDGDENTDYSFGNEKLNEFLGLDL